MADRINVDTQLLEELSSQILQLQRSLSGVDTRLGSAISDVRRVASDQTGIINRLNRTRKNLETTSDRLRKLARATGDAADRWEETENKIAGLELPMTDVSETGDGSVSPDGSGNGAEQGNWWSAIEEFFGRNISAAKHQNDVAYRTWQYAALIYHWVRGEEFSSGSINEVSFHGEYNGVECDISAWNNDYVGLQWQEVEVDGVKQRMLVPYISYGQGIDIEPIHNEAGIETPDGNAGLHAEASVADIYVGSKTQVGFENGEFILHIGGGASATAASAGLGASDRYESATVTLEAGSIGTDVQIDYKDGVLSVEGLISLEEGVGLDLSFDVGKYVNDWQEAIDGLTQGNYVSAAEKLWDVLSVGNPASTFIPNPISTARSIL